MTTKLPILPLTPALSDSVIRENIVFVRSLLGRNAERLFQARDTLLLFNNDC